MSDFESIDIAKAYLRATHHASSGKHSIVYRVRRDVRIVTAESDLEDHQVMNVLKVIPNHFLRVFGCTVEND